MGERVHRSVMNIKVGMLFFVLSLFLAFFSRKIFLDCLGAEFIGLTGMLMNIMSYLSVAELGIGLSISYFLYKPLQEDNHDKINEVMSMLAFLYRRIGFFIGICGFVISLFFPWWFGHLSVSLFLVYFAFYSFLASSMAGYIFNYKNILVGANQKQYLVSAYFQSISIVQSLVQIVLAYYYHNLYLWVVVGFVFTVIGIILFNYRIRQLYPWRLGAALRGLAMAYHSTEERTAALGHHRHHIHHTLRVVVTYTAALHGGLLLTRKCLLALVNFAFHYSVCKDTKYF